MSIRILLADDHVLMRQELRRILEQHADFEIVAEAASGLEAVKSAERCHPDVAVIDVGMKEPSGIEAAAEINRISPQTGVLILSMYSDERYVVRSVRAGARGFVLKEAAGEELVCAIRTVRNGFAFFSPAVAAVLNRPARLRDSRDAVDRYESLTDPERQVYRMLAEGKGNREIAKRLDVSLQAVETHRWRIMHKMDLHSVAELLLSAVRRGFVN